MRYVRQTEHGWQGAEQLGGPWMAIPEPPLLQSRYEPRAPIGDETIALMASRIVMLLPGSPLDNVDRAVKIARALADEVERTRAH